MGRRHPLHSPLRRGLASCALVAVVMLVGTLGIHHFEGVSYLDAFYFMSMIATAQGTATVPVTPAGKLFTALIAFVSVGSVVAALGFLFGPFFGKLWRVGVDRMEDEVRQLTHHDKK